MDSLLHQAMQYSGAGALYNQSPAFDPNAPLNKLEAAAVQIYCAHIIAKNDCGGTINLIQSSVREAQHLLQQCQY